MADDSYDQDPDASENEQVLADPGDQQAPAPSQAIPTTVGGEMQSVLQHGAQDAAGPGNAPHQVLRRGMNSAASAILSYLHGDGAADPATVQQVEQQVDPQGQMDDGERHLRAIKAAHDQGGPGAAWSFVQANRQAYNGKMAFAKAALQGTQGKPPDILAAAQAASDAYAHVPDGKQISFQPSQTAPGSITATVTTPEGTPQTRDLTPEQFGSMLDIGKDGLYDKVFHSGFPTLDGSGFTKGNPAPQDPSKPYSAPGSVSKPTISTGEVGSTPVGADPSRNRSISGSTDAGTGYAPELVARAKNIFPGVNNAQRAKWLAQQQEQRDTAEAEQTNKVTVAEAGNIGKAYAADKRLEGSLANSQNRKEGVLGAAQIRAQGDQVKQATMIAAQAARNGNQQLAIQMHALNGWQTTHPGEQLPPQMQQVLDNIMKLQPGQQPQGGGAPQNGGVQQRTLKDGRKVNVRQVAPGKWQVVQ